MLERFKVSHDDAEFVQGDDLRRTVAGIFEKLGVPPEDALLAADVQVLADLRGVDSHGVSNMLKSYITGYQEGSINPRPDWKVRLSDAIRSPGFPSPGPRIRNMGVGSKRFYLQGIHRGVHSVKLDLPSNGIVPEQLIA